MDKARKNELKKQVRLAERQRWLDAMPVSVVQFEALLNGLDNCLDETPCNHDHSLTEKCCSELGFDPIPLVNWAKENGGYCDCELLANLEDPFEDAKMALI